MRIWSINKRINITFNLFQKDNFLSKFLFKSIILLLLIIIIGVLIIIINVTLRKMTFSTISQLLFPFIGRLMKRMWASVNSWSIQRKNKWKEHQMKELCPFIKEWKIKSLNLSQYLLYSENNQCLTILA